MDKSCSYCFKPLPTGSRKTFCDSRCRHSFNLKQVERKCKRCSCIVGKGKSYCVTCKKEREGEYGRVFIIAEHRKCKLCGSDFLVKGRDHLSKFCSVTCRRDSKNEYLKKRRGTENLPPKKRGYRNIFIKECDVTGRLFVAKRQNETISKLGIIADRELKYINRFPKQRPCKNCGKIVTNISKDGKPLMKRTCDDCLLESRREDRRRHKYIRRQRMGNVSKVKNKIVFQIAGWICCHCGVNTYPFIKQNNHRSEPTLDHIVPLSKGGDHAYHNVQLLCRSCNGKKSDKLIENERLLRLPIREGYGDIQGH
jgi:5-methylcytosine-specific restriction endonuclease McrA